jgi:hypothetical protein
MLTSKCSSIDTKPLSSDIIDLDYEVFYDFVRLVSEKRVAELLAFQECNGVNSLLRRKDVTAVFHLQSDQLNDIKKIRVLHQVMELLLFFQGLNHQLVILINSLKRNEKKSTNKLNEFNPSLQFYQQLYRYLMLQFTQLHYQMYRFGR